MIAMIRPRRISTEAIRHRLRGTAATHSAEGARASADFKMASRCVAMKGV
jgi:hypothetical protein